MGKSAKSRTPSPEKPSYDYRQGEFYSLRSFFEISSEAFCVVTPKGVLVDCNSAFEKVFGYTKQELKKMPLTQLLSPASQTVIQETMRILQDNGTSTGVEINGVRKSGETIPLCWTTAYDKSLKLIYVAAKDLSGERDLQRETKLLVDTISDGYVVQTESGEILSFNASALSILGLTEDQLRGRTSADPRWKAIRENGEIFPGDQHPAMRAIRENRKIEGEVMGLELPSGQKRWIRITSVPFQQSFKGSSGYENRRMVISAFTDVTNLILSKVEMNLVLHSLKLGIWKFYPKTNQLIWDEQMYEVFEANPKDFSGHYHAWESSLTPEAKEQAIRELGLALSGEKEFQTTFEIITRGGKRKWIGGIGKVFRDSSGNPEVMYGVNWDRTDEVSKDLKIKEYKDLLETVLSSIPIMVTARDCRDDYRFKLVNQHAASIFGMKKESVLNKTFKELFPDKPLKSEEALDRSMVSEESFSEEWHHGGESRVLKSKRIPIFDEKDQPKMLLQISEDVTEELKAIAHKERDRLKAIHQSKLASLGEMSAGVAHEINNPLAIVIGSIPLLEKARGNIEEFQRKSQAILKACLRIEKIVKGLRKFARVTGKSDHKSESLSEILNEAMVLVETRSKRYAVPVRLEISSDLRILCDSVEIEQVVVNLVNNAIDAVKATRDPWVKVELRSEDKHAVIRVIDSGLGIPKEVEAKLFEPFFTTKAVGEGTGLGLSIVKGIVEQHQGTITVGRIAENTCFEVRFPTSENIVDLSYMRDGA